MATTDAQTSSGPGLVSERVAGGILPKVLNIIGSATAREEPLPPEAQKVAGAAGG